MTLERSVAAQAQSKDIPLLHVAVLYLYRTVTPALWSQYRETGSAHRYNTAYNSIMPCLVGHRRGRPLASVSSGGFLSTASTPLIVPASASALIVLTCTLIMVGGGALGASVPVPPTHPAYYDLIRTSPEEMGVIQTRTDPTGQCNVVEFKVRDETDPKQDNTTTLYLADITALLPYTIRHYHTNACPTCNVHPDDSISRPGVTDDAAALLLAVTHFNQGMTPNVLGSLKPDVQKKYEGCNVKLTTELFDTGYSPIQSTRLLSDVLDRPHTEETAPIEPLPAAVLGAFRSASTSPTAILSGVSDLPQLSYRSSSTNFDNKEQYPYFGRTVPSSSSDASAVVSYLQYLEVEYVGVIFVTDAFGSSFQKSLQDAAGEVVPPIRTDSVSFGYLMDLDPRDNVMADDGGDSDNKDDEVRNAVAGLASTGYRYFVALVGEEHYDRIMREASRQGLTGPEYVWIFAGGVDRKVWQNLARYQEDDVLADATNGIAIIQTESAQFGQEISAGTGMMEGNYSNAAPSAISASTANDRFRQAWSDAISDPVMIEYFREKQPTDVIQKQGQQAVIFSAEPSQFSYFIYDAIQSLGLAMCQMSTSGSGPFYPGPLVYEQFLEASFEGASGQLDIDPATGTRAAVGVTYTVWNARSASTPKQGIVGFDLHPTTHIVPVPDLDDKSKAQFVLEHVQPFVYNDETSQQPDTLPPPEVNQNLIGDAGRTAGYVLMGIVIFLGLLCLFWAYLNRASRVVQASQPIFIGLVIAGCVVMSAATIPFSMEETTVKDESGLDIACMASQWIYYVGFAIAFSALLTKTWSVYQIYRKPDVDTITLRPVHFAKTLGALLLVNIIVLLSWTFVAPLKWTRVEGESKDAFDRSINSYATCSAESGSALPFRLVLVTFNLGVLIVANVLAYKCRDVSIEYQENRYIAISMASILQAWAMGIPILIVVKDSPQAKFFVEVAIIFVTCSSILLLMFVPKMFSYRAEKRKILEEERRSTMRSVNARISQRARDYDEEPDNTNEENEGISVNDNPQATSSYSVGIESAPSSEQRNNTTITETAMTEAEGEKLTVRTEQNGNSQSEISD